MTNGRREKLRTKGISQNETPSTSHRDKLARDSIVRDSIVKQNRSVWYSQFSQRREYVILESGKRPHRFHFISSFSFTRLDLHADYALACCFQLDSFFVLIFARAVPEAYREERTFICISH